MADDRKRQTDLKLKLGSDQVEPVWLDAYEALSQHFQITLDILSTLGPIDLVPYLGKPAAVENLVDGDHSRYFHGIVVDGRFVEEYGGAGFVYRLTLRPEAFFHSQGSNFKIFQEKSAKSIIEEVLGKCTIEFEFKAKGATRIREYCVQYGESDFSFVCRLMEEEGLYYYYVHKADSHLLVICDEPASHPKLAEATLTFNPGTVSSTHADLGPGAFVQKWTEHVASGAEQKVTFRDYNFEKPRQVLESVATDLEMHSLDAIEVYSWPGRFVEPSDGKELATFLLDSRRAQRRTFEGVSQLAAIQTGHTFTLKDHEVDDFNQSYLIISSHVSLAAEQHRPGMENKGGCIVHFTTIPGEVQYRAPMVTPRPLAKGPETAVVTGPAGEELFVDKYGRIKVHFFWDRDQPSDDKSSCWIRVSQTGGLGNTINPRIGHEVLVDFISGDPDRPIVVGTVFNPSNMPAYALPANATRAVWRTKTHKQDTGSDLPGIKALDTGQPGANEVRMEDKEGAEEFFLHAERDMNTRVRRRESHHVGEDQIIDVGGNRTKLVEKDETTTINQNRTEKVAKNETTEIGSNQEIHIMSNKTEKVDSDYKLNVGNNLTIEAGNEIKIKAGSKITLEVGGSTITIDTCNVKIATTMLEMEGKATSKLLGGLTNVEAKAILTAKGALVMIN